MAFKIDQIYTLVNDVAKQSMGTDAITALDTSTLVALGDSVLSSSENTEGFCNTLVQRIGKTIISYRKYTNTLGDMVVSDFKFGAILQKMKVAMPEAVEDASYKLENGKSVDQYIVSAPTVKQKLFMKETPYTFFVTIQRVQLQEAFLSENAMGSFISAVFGEVENKLELSMENMGRLSICNMAALLTGNRVINLVTMYNALTASEITSATAMFDADFMRWAIGRINLVSDNLKTMSTLYNEEGETRHTPFTDQMYIVNNEFKTQLETVVQYAAFNERFVSKVSNITCPYWQAAQNPLEIKVIPSGKTEEVAVTNMVAAIFDRDACGTYKNEIETLTTPINARARYTNTYWHEKQLWFNDISENAVIFTLN